MADDFSFTPGSGATGAADDVGGVLYPRVKLDWGADGTANDTDTAAGKALPVQLRDTSGNEIGTSAHPVRTDPTGSTTQPVSASSLPLPTGAATESTLGSVLTTSDFDTKVGSLTETAPTSDTASSGLNGRLQRIAQRLTTLIGLLPTALGSNGGLKIEGVASGQAVPVSGTFYQSTQPVSIADGSDTTLGSKADAKNSATDTTAITAMSVLKQVSASIQAAAASLAGTLTVATHAVTQSGTWTVQPGNTANTTAWKVDASGAAVPVTDNSGSLTVDAPVSTPVFVTPTPSTTGGWSKSKYAAQTTTVQTVKSSAGTFGGYFVYNPNSSVAYIQVFDASSVTLGTTAPDMIFGIPATSGANLEISNGVNMATAIKLACTTTATGSTAPSTGLDITVFYK